MGCQLNWSVSVHAWSLSHTAILCSTIVHRAIVHTGNILAVVAPLAQSAEHSHGKAGVVGSIPTGGSSAEPIFRFYKAPIFIKIST